MMNGSDGWMGAGEGWAWGMSGLGGIIVLVVVLVGLSIAFLALRRRDS